MTIMVVTGAPGAGKSTTARLLAGRVNHGYHLEVDQFFASIPQLVDPSLPESDQQNRAITRAVGCTAQSLSRDGYHVVVDGVLGPWMLSEFEKGLQGSAYTWCLLKVSPAVALARIEQRPEQPVPSRVVKQMIRSFDAAESVAGAVCVNADELNPEEICALLIQRLGQVISG